MKWGGGFRSFFFPRLVCDRRCFPFMPVCVEICPLEGVVLLFYNFGCCDDWLCKLDAIGPVSYLIWVVLCFQFKISVLKLEDIGNVFNYYGLILSAFVGFLSWFFSNFEFVLAVVRCLAVCEFVSFQHYLFTLLGGFQGQPLSSCLWFHTDICIYVFQLFCFLCWMSYY